MKYHFVFIALVILASCDNKTTTQLSPNESATQDMSVAFTSGTFQDLSASQAMSIPETVYLDVRTQEEVDMWKRTSNVDGVLYTPYGDKIYVERLKKKSI